MLPLYNEGIIEVEYRQTKKGTCINNIDVLQHFRFAFYRHNKMVSASH